MIGVLLKSAKFWAILAAVTATLAFITWGYNQVYDAGYNAAELKWTKDQQKAINEAVAEATRQTALAYAEGMRNIETETEIVERVRIIEREVPRIVERVVRPECRDLGPDIQRLYNDAIIASGATGTEIDGSAEPGE